MRLDASDAGKLLLRVTIGVLLLLHGIHKLRHGIDGIIGNVERHGLPSFFAYLVYVGEVAAPLLVIAGWQTRIAAAIVAINMAVAIWLSHAADVFLLTDKGAWAIELPALYLLGAVAIALLGSGRYAVSRGAGRFD